MIIEIRITRKKEICIIAIIIIIIIIVEIVSWSWDCQFGLWSSG